MRVAVIQQHGDDIHRDQDADAFKKPKRPALKSADDDFHANVTAELLTIGNGEKGKDDHGEFDEVDITGDWKIYDLSPEDLKHTQEHQAHNDDTRQ